MVESGVRWNQERRDDAYGAGLPPPRGRAAGAAGARLSAADPVSEDLG
jgi:hypothetical protein